MLNRLKPNNQLKIGLLAFACLTGLWLSSTTSANESPSALPDAARPEGHSPAVLIDDSEPVYPRPALHENREGWVRVGFEINREGRVVNAVVEESVGGSIFETAATRSVSRWRFEPAQLNGRPVSQPRNSTIVTFALNEQARGSSKRFADRYNDILELIKKNQLERADALARSVFDQWPLNLYELTKLWSLRAELSLIQNNFRAAESALRKATANRGRWLDADAYRSLLLARVHVDLELGQFKKAIDLFEELIALDPDRSDELTQTARMIRSLQNIIDSDQTLATDGLIQRNEGCEACRATWTFEPLRRTFTVASIDGMLEALVMNCTNVKVPFEFIVDKTWYLPANSGQCEVGLFGSEGTAFRVYQLANP